MRPLLVLLAVFVLFACTEAPQSTAAKIAAPETTAVCEGDLVRGLFSPDGAAVACTGAKYRGLSLHFLRDGKKAVLSTAEGAGIAPAWSPDGANIAFRERYDTADGVRERIVTVKAADLSRAVEADGLTVTMPLFWRGALTAIRPDTLRPTLFHGPDASTRIAALPTAVTTPAGVKILPAPDAKPVALAAGSHSPIVSPDGRWVSYIEGNAVRLYDLASGSDRRLTGGSHPVWMPNGRGLVVAVTRDDGRDIAAATLYLVSLDGAARRIVTAPGAIPLYPDVTADGARILYTDHATGRILVQSLVTE
ncbi:MAG TPA: hypothetical protein P5077_00680 [bacterium]|nr:hypothetical protein [bacterium]